VWESLETTNGQPDFRVFRLKDLWWLKPHDSVAYATFATRREAMDSVRQWREAPAERESESEDAGPEKCPIIPGEPPELPAAAPTIPRTASDTQPESEEPVRSAEFAQDGSVAIDAVRHNDFWIAVRREKFDGKGRLREEQVVLLTPREAADLAAKIVRLLV
jgi:hypothetical protein